MQSNKSIAVLPFVNMSSHEENEYFSDGVTEEIINALAKIPGLLVTSRTSSFAFKNQNTDIREIGKKLGVGTLVEGSVRRSANQVRITAQLINAEEDFHYWSKTYDHELEDIFKIQDEIALDVAEKYRESIGHFDIADHLVENKAASIEAYDLSLRAIHNFNDLSAEGVSTAIELIEQAIKLEPENASYLATKSIFFTTLGTLGAFPMSEAYQVAMEASKKSLAIDNLNVNANTSFAFLSFAYDGDIAKYQEHIVKALDKEAHNVLALCLKAIVEACVGNDSDSMGAIDSVIGLDPLSPLPFYLKASCLLILRRYDESIESFDHLLKMYPQHISGHAVKGLTLARMGRVEDAIKQFENTPIGPNKTQPYFTGLGMAYALKGDVAKAEEYMGIGLKEDSSLQLAYNENGTVIINLLLKKYNECFAELEKDITDKAYYLKFYLGNPWFDQLSSDPRSKMLEDIFISESPKSKRPKKYAKSGLSQQDINRINKDLMDFIEKEKPFLDPEVSLKKLAADIGTSGNNLSQIINTKTNNNFFDFINTLRIEELKRLLGLPENKQYTLLTLAYDAGFNSKSAFNSSFKKLTGKTPTEFIKAEGL